MKVEELIKQLKTCPKDQEVNLLNMHTGQIIPIIEIGCTDPELPCSQYNPLTINFDTTKLSQKTYRYYITLGPVGSDNKTYPISPKPKRVVNFGKRISIDSCFKPWGYVEYGKRLTNFDIMSYCLLSAN
jgi:hypothetical protein